MEDINETNVAPTEEIPTVPEVAPAEEVLTTPTEIPTEPEIPQPAGALFGAIAYKQVDDIPIFIEKMKINDAAFILLSVAKYAHAKGILSLLESEVVSKAIRVFTTPPSTSMPLEP